jgi:hypothetical protein
MTSPRSADDAAISFEPVTGVGGWSDREGLRRSTPAAATAPTTTSTTGHTTVRRAEAIRAFALPATWLVLVYVIGVWTTTGQRIENAGMLAADRLGGSTELLATIVYTSVSYSTLLFGLFVVAGFGLWRGGFLRAVVAPSVLGVSIVIVELLKYVILPRPQLYASARWLRYPSFPSGHTTIAVGLAAAAMFVATDRTRRAVHVGGFVYASLMGLSLIVTANHRLSDEIGSCLVVYLAAQVAAIVLPTTTIRPTSGPSVRRAALAWGASVGAAAVFAGFLTGHGSVTVAFECIAYLAVCRATLRRISALT